MIVLFFVKLNHSAVEDNNMITCSLSFEPHVKNIINIKVFFRLTQIAMLRLARKKRVYTFGNSRLDYCNALLSGSSTRDINKLQVILNAAATVLIKNLKIRAYFDTALYFHIVYKKYY